MMGQLQLGGLALDRVADRASHEVAGGVLLHEVVLRTLLEGVQREALVVVSGQDDDRQLGLRGLDPPDAFQAARVRKREVEQGTARILLAEVLAGIGQELVMGELDVPPEAVGQHLGHERGVVAAVLYQDDGHPLGQDYGAGLRHRQRPPGAVASAQQDPAPWDSFAVVPSGPPVG